MRGATHFKRLLWGVNALLGLGILVFSSQVLFRASRTTLGLEADDDLPHVPVRPKDESDGALKTLENPVEKRALAGRAPSPFRATLRGTLAGEVAFLRSTARNIDLVATVGGTILEDGRPCEDFRGWTLAAVGRDTALFAGPRGERVELAIDDSPGTSASGPAPAASARAASPAKSYAAGAYRSRLLAASQGRQVWGIDPEEIEWAAENVPQILDRDLRITPYAGGGVRVDVVAPDSIGAARGLLAGDVLREVNGRPVGGISDLRPILESPLTKTDPGFRLTIERAGKPLVLEYRPLPR